MGDSALIAAYTGEDQQNLPSAGVAALGGTYPTTAPATGAPGGTRLATAADQLVQQIAQEADLAASSNRSNRAPIVIAGIPLGAIGDPTTAAIEEEEEEDTIAPSSLATASGMRRPRILLGVSGSVATIKLTQLTHQLLEFAEVHIVTTKSARHFFNQADLPPECGPVLTDEDEWRNWKAVGDPVVHIELRRWADVLVIAPLSANTLAKMANGLCDNLLTCVVRAWDSTKPVLVAPAMNTYMWQSPFTSQHVTAIQKLGFRVIAPVEKKLACGDVGNGGMAASDTIANAVKEACLAAGLFVD